MSDVLTYTHNDGRVEIRWQRAPWRGSLGLGAGGGGARAAPRALLPCGPQHRPCRRLTVGFAVHHGLGGDDCVCGERRGTGVGWAVMARWWWKWGTARQLMARAMHSLAGCVAGEEGAGRGGGRAGTGRGLWWARNRQYIVSGLRRRTVDKQPRSMHYFRTLGHMQTGHACMPMNRLQPFAALRAL